MRAILFKSIIARIGQPLAKITNFRFATLKLRFFIFFFFFWASRLLVPRRRRAIRFTSFLLLVPRRRHFVLAPIPDALLLVPRRRREDGLTPNLFRILVANLYTTPERAAASRRQRVIGKKKGRFAGFFNIVFMVERRWSLPPFFCFVFFLFM